MYDLRNTKYEFLNAWVHDCMEKLVELDKEKEFNLASYFSRLAFIASIQ
ncbi:MAG: hypothetical protein HYS25_05515 [Ignavibacteriales bacterium]|nr:hypothetical protein [Ignavibacteriales bacterium]